MPPRPHPFRALNSGALSEITKFLGARNHVRLAAVTRNRNMMRHAAQRTQASIATIGRYRDKFAQRVAGIITRVIAAHRKNPTRIDSYDASVSSNPDDEELDIETALNVTSRGKFLKIRYWQPQPQHGAYTVGTAFYYVRIQNGAYRLVTASKFSVSGHPSRTTLVYMRAIHRRAIQLYKERPLPAWT